MAHKLTSIATLNEKARFEAERYSLLCGREEELQWLTEGLEKTAAVVAAWKSASTKVKFSSTASSQDQLPTYRPMDE